MSLPLWGQLQKSQDDSETIEEAIVRLIGEHEADPTAHLGEGESLSEHKQDSTIDHPAGSVLADKKTMTEMSIDHDFSDISFWGQTGQIDTDNWPSVGLYVEWGEVNTSRMYMTPQIPSPFLSYSHDMVFQSIVQLNVTGSNVHAWWGMGLVDDTPGDGFGFVVQSGVLKAVIAAASSATYSAALDVDLDAGHIYRAQLLPSEGVARFYVDGEEVAELAIPVSSPDSDAGPDFGVRLSGSNDGYMYIADLHFSRSII